MTWSERQAQAKARDAEEEKGSLAGECIFHLFPFSREGGRERARADFSSHVLSSPSLSATAAVVGTTIASGASKVASSLPSFPARSTPPAPTPQAPATDSDDGFDEPDAPPPPAPPLASRPPPQQASAAPSFPDEDDFDEPDAPPPPPPPAPVVRAPIVNAAPSFPDDDDFEDDEPPAIPPPPPAPVPAIAAVVAAPVESVKKAYESIKETLVGPSEPAAEESKAGGGGGGGKKAKVLFDYEATEDNELALREGEILVELEMVDEGWWSAKGEKGDVGLVS